MFKNIVNWITSHIVIVAILIPTVLVIGILGVIISIKFFFVKESTTNDNNIKEKVIMNGTYSCEFLYNGKNFDDNETFILWLEAIAKYNGEDFNIKDIDDIDDYRNEIYDYFGNITIEKSEKEVSIKTAHDGIDNEVLIYSIKSEKFSLGNDVTHSDTWDDIIDVFNKNAKTKLSSKSFTIENFFSIELITNVKNKNGSLENLKFTNTGDIVCQTLISPTEEVKDNLENKEESKIDELNLYKPILDKEADSWLFQDEYTLQYALYDINKDGINELIVKVSPYEGIVGVYYLDNKTPKELVTTCGGRCYIDIYDNGTIFEGGSSGACSGGYSYHGNIKSKNKSSIKDWADFGEIASVEYTCIKENGVWDEQTMYYDIMVRGKYYHEELPIDKLTEDILDKYPELNITKGKNIVDRLEWHTYK